MMPKKNWKEFLRCDENNAELFSFLTNGTVNCPIIQCNELHVTYETDVRCSPVYFYANSIAPRLQDEADTRRFLHVADYVQKGCKK